MGDYPNQLTTQPPLHVAAITCCRNDQRTLTKRPDAIYFVGVDLAPTVLGLGCRPIENQDMCVHTFSASGAPAEGLGCCFRDVALLQKLLSLLQSSPRRPGWIGASDGAGNIFSGEMGAALNQKILERLGGTPTQLCAGLWTFISNVNH